MKLTFEHVSQISLQRAMLWHPRGLNEWSESDWSNAMAGEAGEVCNAVKNLRRIQCGLTQSKGPKTADEAIAEIAKEIGDTYLYLDLLAARMGLKIEDCIRDTFNRVSEREGFPQRISICVDSTTPPAPPARSIGTYLVAGIGRDAGTVVDELNGLQWQTDDDGIRRKLTEAEKYCAKLRLADYTDWRLPTEEELLTLVDRKRYSPAINIELFPNTASEFYWSSTPYAYGPADYAWGVYFDDGDTGIDGRDSGGFVRAVRSVVPASPGQ